MTEECVYLSSLISKLLKFPKFPKFPNLKAIKVNNFLTFGYISDNQRNTGANCIIIQNFKQFIKNSN